MAIPAKGLTSLRTLAGRARDQNALPYRRYMQITCLEMEKARRGMELKSARQRIAAIDARLEQIEKAKQELLEAVAATGEVLPARLPGFASKPEPPRSAGGFKIRY